MQVSEVRDSELVSRRTETSYKAESLGKAAPHVNARGTGDTVNGALHKGSSRSYPERPFFQAACCLFPMKLPVGATGTQCPGTDDGRLCLICELRNKDEQAGNRSMQRHVEQFAW